jgi:hypothetical protein
MDGMRACGCAQSEALNGKEWVLHQVWKWGWGAGDSEEARA